MNAPAEAVRCEECPRCGDSTLVVREAGLTHRMGRWSVPVADAMVLARWGVATFRLTRAGRWFYLGEFISADSKQVLVTTHLCGWDPRPVQIQEKSA